LLISANKLPIVFNIYPKTIAENNIHNEVKVISKSVEGLLFTPAVSIVLKAQYYE
jgi:hypothetical protein